MSVAGRLSVIVPTLNERGTLPDLLDDLRAQQDLDLECIVADASSDDGTAELARARGATVIDCGRGRGWQMNAGARTASGEWLLFLHADSRLDDPHLLRDALTALQSEPGGEAIVAGHFRLRFARSGPGHERFFRFLEAKSASNRRHTINGDQGLLIARRHFERLGGYDESLPIFEDQRIAARIFACGRWVLLPGTLTTSARRFEAEGHAARYALMAIMMGAHAAGLDEFLRAAPRLYVPQGEARALQLAVFRRALRELLAQRSLRETLDAVWQCGRLARDNAWQLALLLDLRHGARGCDGPALHLFDRRIAPLLDNPLADGLAAVLAAFWFFAWLPLQRGL
ncbi:TIGR04283 family arsenosugar biosynthesis glycosyltransferase [Fontimonas sp. SYSU GA230001]|uniref:TIGR04283 family arsenosugar biosynthesis glycosyltransferase n=1 Tax=Fontimonas sp. SYSU GA230001 TaxID=3142450 RepID=UPI0032B454B2